MYFNKSFDGGTFEEATPSQRMSCWIEFRQQALFQVDFYLSIECKDMATRYYKLLNYIENRMLKTDFING